MESAFLKRKLENAHSKQTAYELLRLKTKNVHCIWRFKAFTILERGTMNLGLQRVNAVRKHALLRSHALRTKNINGVLLCY